MSFVTITLAAMTIVGKEISTSNQVCLPAMQALWQDILTTNALATIADKKSESVAYGLYSDYAATFKGATTMQSIVSEKYSYTVGMQVAKSDVVPAGMVVKQVPAATYAVFTCSSTEIGTTWQTIWATPLKRTFVGDFEEYDFANPSQVKIYIGIDPVAA